MSKQDNLKRLLSPSSIVLIGGSNLTLPISNTNDIGFDGDIWVVNPKYDEIEGIKCYPSVADLPGIPDAAFISVNSQLTVQAVAELSAAGCGGAVCYAAGFAEMGHEGEELQTKLVQAAGDMALVGPNCYGLLNFTNGVALWPDRLSGEKTQKGVAIISQSGNVALNITMNDRSLPITHVISVGNQAVLGVGDYIEPLLENDSVAAIGFYIEGLKDIESFSRAALKAVEKGIPLVVLKAGTSDIGTQLTMSHTSSLAGSDDMYQSMFDRLGILRVDSIAELLETLKIAALCELPEGDSIGVLTCSGGDSAMMADSLDLYDLPLPQLSNEQSSKLKELLPGFASLSNPLDYNTSIWGDIEACTEVFSVMMSGNYDASVLVLDFPKEGLGDDREWQVAVDSMIAAHANHRKTAAIICNLPELLPDSARARLVDAGIAPLQGMKEGVSALAKVIRYSAKRKDILALSDAQPLLLRQGTLTKGESRMLDEWDSKQLVGSYGLPLPPGGGISDITNVAEMADQVGYPVVMKGVSDKLAHKTEAGAVALNLKDSAEVVAAAEKMSESLKQHGLSEFKFLIEPMISDFVGEIIIGLKRDEQFGLALIIGTGGILVNLLNDSATLLLPTSREAVTEAINSLKGSKLLKGYRGKPEGDLDAVVDAAMAVAEFGMEYWDQITELDINPLMVRPKGKGAVAVDALVHLIPK